MCSHPDVCSGWWQRITFGSAFASVSWTMPRGLTFVPGDVFAGHGVIPTFHNLTQLTDGVVQTFGDVRWLLHTSS